MRPKSPISRTAQSSPKVEKDGGGKAEPSSNMLWWTESSGTVSPGHPPPRNPRTPRCFRPWVNVVSSAGSRSPPGHKIVRCIVDREERDEDCANRALSGEQHVTGRNA